MADIFVSYAREDRSRVRELAECLQQNGWTVWWDKQIRAGEEFDEVIQREIRIARCVIVAWSQHSVRSRWVKNEADEALRRQVLVPIQLDDAEVPLGFRNIQTVAFGGLALAPPSPAFDDLLAALTSLLGVGTRPLVPPSVESPSVTTPTSLPSVAPVKDQLFPAPPESRQTQPADSPHVDPAPAVPPRPILTKPRALLAGVALAMVATGWALLHRNGANAPNPNAPAVTPTVESVAPTHVESTPSRPPQTALADAGGPGAAPPAANTSRPPAPERAGDAQQLRELVSKYLSAVSSTNIDRTLECYGDTVDYFDKGLVTREAVRQDKQFYFRRWPNVQQTLDGDIEIGEGTAPNTWALRFPARYEVANSARSARATGTIDMRLVVARANGDLKIIGQKETAKSTPAR
jgi:hypothetical protein